MSCFLAQPKDTHSVHCHRGENKPEKNVKDDYPKSWYLFEKLKILRFHTQTEPECFEIFIDKCNSFSTYLSINVEPLIRISALISNFLSLSHSVPRIPWAFAMAEACGVILCNIWLLVLLLHKHR